MARPVISPTLALRAAWSTKWTPHRRLTTPTTTIATDLLQDGIVMVNGDLLLGLRPVDAERAGDRFDPFRCGLDHLSFAVAGRAELEAAVQAFEERGVEHSDIDDLPPFGIVVLPFKDPDGVALELTAPL